jgi:hypothetical protein
VFDGGHRRQIVLGLSREYGQCVARGGVAYAVAFMMVFASGCGGTKAQEPDGPIGGGATVNDMTASPSISLVPLPSSTRSVDTSLKRPSALLRYPSIEEIEDRLDCREPDFPGESIYTSQAPWVLVGHCGFDGGVSIVIFERDAASSFRRALGEIPSPRDHYVSGPGFLVAVRAEQLESVKAKLVAPDESVRLPSRWCSPGRELVTSFYHYLRADRAVTPDMGRPREAVIHAYLRFGELLDRIVEQIPGGSPISPLAASAAADAHRLVRLARAGASRLDTAAGSVMYSLYDAIDVACEGD